MSALPGPSTSAARLYRTVRELVYAHAGRPAVVLGGGPSLPAELERCPPRGEAIYLSANDHGALLTECDYLVCHDKIEEKLRPFGKPIISRHLFADWRIPGSIVASTGVETAWVARLMGCGPIFICGMDCFAGKSTYHHDPDAKSNGFLIPTSLHLKRWVETLAKYSADYRPVGGPLVRALTSRAGCLRTDPVSREQILAELDDLSAFVMLPAPMTHGCTTLPAGRIEVTRAEAKAFVKRGTALAA